MEKRKKTVQIPDEPRKRDTLPLAVFVGEEDDDDRDPTKPITFDEQGRPLYAPRGGHVFRIHWPR